jgi:tetratricopeptide (TPR) repeat protein
VPEPLAEPMQAAIRAMASRQLDEAEIILDGLLTAAPDWAEAWNKRATLAYIRGDDIEAVADILATLALEPRHFGALSGLGQICLRQGEPEVAKLAFEAALRINPRLDGIADVLGELANPRRSLN